MSSTVRHVAIDSRPHVFLPTSAVSMATLYDNHQHSEQKRFFDLRRSLMISDDSRRLHLEEIQEMMSPASSSRAVNLEGRRSGRRVSVSRTS